MGDLFNIQKKVLIPEHQFKAILSENEKKKKNLLHLISEFVSYKIKEREKKLKLRMKMT